MHFLLILFMPKRGTVAVESHLVTWSALPAAWFSKTGHMSKSRLPHEVLRANRELKFKF
jgi:hypothetical protein